MQRHALRECVCRGMHSGMRARARPHIRGRHASGWITGRTDSQSVRQADRCTQADPEFIAKCIHVANRVRIRQCRWLHAQGQQKTLLNRFLTQVRRMFCSMMAQLDHGVGRVADALKQQDMWRDTHMVFTTDNGGMASVGGNNMPFRGQKVDTWEGGVRGPAFFRWKGGKHAGSRYEGLVHICDWLPTLLKLSDEEAGSTFMDPREWTVDGFDLHHALTDGSQPRQTVVPQLDIFMNSTAIRDGCLKLMLGSPGWNMTYKEPTNWLFPDSGLAYKLLELWFTLVEYLVAPPLDQLWCAWACPYACPCACPHACLHTCIHT